MPGETRTVRKGWSVMSEYNAEYHSEYHRKRYKNDPEYRERLIMRSRIQTRARKERQEFLLKNPRELDRIREKIMKGGRE